MDAFVKDMMLQVSAWILQELDIFLGKQKLYFTLS